MVSDGKWSLTFKAYINFQSTLICPLAIFNAKRTTLVDHHLGLSGLVCLYYFFFCLSFSIFWQRFHIVYCSPQISTQVLPYLNKTTSLKKPAQNGRYLGCGKEKPTYFNIRIISTLNLWIWDSYCFFLLWMWLW